MKKFSLLKLISLIFICAMLMSAVAITAFAEGEQEATPTVVKIVSKNIYFGDDIQLMFAVDAPEGAHVSATVDGESIGIERFEVEGMSYPVWKTKSGWAAQNINTVVTVTVEYDGVKDVLTYSVLEYLHERIAKLNGEGNLDVEVSEGAGYTKRDQLDMYNALLDYAKAADKVVNAGHPNDLDNYFEVKVVDGTIDGYKSWGVYKLGSYPFADIATTLDYNPNTHVVVWSYTWSGGTETGLTTDEIKDVEVTGDLVITAELEEFKCDHQYTVIEQVNATCTEDGYAIYKCSNPVCGDSYKETLPATEHDYKETVTPPTCTEQGYTTFTCSVCGDEYEGNYVDATDHNYESERTEPTCKKDGKIVYTCACGHSYAETLKATGHTTANGKCDNCGMIIATVNEWQIVKNAADLKVGDEIFISAADGNIAMSTNQKTNNRGQIKYTINGATVETDVQIITLEAGTKTGTFAFNVGTGYLCAASSSENYLKTEEKLSDNSSWTIDIASNGSATVKAQGTYTRNWMRYNSSSSLFACYASGQGDIVIYKLVESYTETCAHDGLVLEVETPATCTEDGLKSGHCNICNTDLTETIEATGHNYKDGVCTVCGTKEPTEAPTHECKHRCTVCGLCTDQDCNEGVCEEKCQGHVVYKNVNYSYTFTAKQWAANGDKTLGNLTWTLAGDGGYWGNDTKGHQFGSGNKPYKSMSLTTKSLENVTKIVINASGASSSKITMTVKVGGKTVGTQKLTSTATPYTFTCDNLDGDVVIEFSQTGSKAIYVKSIAIDYQVQE